MGRTASNKKRAQASSLPASKVSPESGLRTAASATQRWKWFGIGAFIFAAAIAVMWPTTKGDFYSDDGFYIQNNPLLDQPGRIWKAFFVPGSFIEYYPIEQSLQWLLYLCFGQHPFGYHIVNLVLHGINALAVWYFLRKFNLRLAWLGGLIYAIYPLSVETVGFISEFKNTLSLAPFIASMCFYLNYARDGKKSAYWFSLAFYAVAMMCKISMMAFPAVLLLYAWYLRGRITLRDLWSCAPFALVAAVLAATSYASGEIYNASIHDMEPGEIPVGGPLSRLALVGITTSFYLTHTLLPYRPLTLYPLWPVDPPSLLQFLPWPLLILGAWWLWQRRNSWGRHVILGVGTFILFLLPALGFIKISYMTLSFVLDHLLYLPVIFLLALVIAGLDDVQRKLSFVWRRVLWGATATAIVVMAVETYTFAGIFADPLELFATDLEYNPGSWFVQSTYGVYLLQYNRIDEATPHFQLAAEMNPHFYMPHLALAKIALRNGDQATAEYQFRELVRVAPFAPIGYTSLGDLLVHENRLPEAYDVIKEEFSKIPDNAQACDDMAQISMGLGHTDEAQQFLRHALKIDPTDSFAKEHLQQSGASGQ